MWPWKNLWCTKRARSSVMALLAVARDLPQDVIPATKPRSGRPPKTSKLTDDVRRQELRSNHHLSASELKEMHQDHLGNVSIRCIAPRPKNDLKTQVDVLPPKLSWLHVWGRSVFNLLWDIFTEVLKTRKGSCGLMNPHSNASPVTNIGHFGAIIDTWILAETSC